MQIQCKREEKHIWDWSFSRWWVYIMWPSTSLLSFAETLVTTYKTTTQKTTNNVKPIVEKWLPRRLIRWWEDIKMVPSREIGLRTDLVWCWTKNYLHSSYLCVLLARLSLRCCVRTFVHRSTLFSTLSTGSVDMTGGPQADPEGTSRLVARKVARRGTAGGGNNELNSVAEPDEAHVPSPVGFDSLAALVIRSCFFCHVRGWSCRVDDTTAGSMQKHPVQ